MTSVLPQHRDKAASYHKTALQVLVQIASQKRGSEGKRLAVAALEFLETQGDKLVRLTREGEGR